MGPQTHGSPDQLHEKNQTHWTHWGPIGDPVWAMGPGAMGPQTHCPDREQWVPRPFVRPIAPQTLPPQTHGLGEA
jgi:hypothetical protein